VVVVVVVVVVVGGGWVFVSVGRYLYPEGDDLDPLELG
jgi:uncharacterized membrane protein YqiK